MANDDEKPICVALDTNVWLSDHLLSTRWGAALLHAVEKHNGKLALIEVVKLELQKHVVKQGMEAVERVLSDSRKIQNLTGKTVPQITVSEEDFSEGLQQRLDTLSPLLIDIPFTLDHAKRALERVVADRPPNGPKNQQYKDSVIWEAALDLSQSYAVYLVTKDNGFFKGGKKENSELATELLKDCRLVGGTVLVFRSVEECVESLQETAPLRNMVAVSLAIDLVISGRIRQDVSEKGFDLGEMINRHCIEAPTPDPSALAVSFQLTYRMIDVASPEGVPRDDATVFAKGDCAYNPFDGNVTEARLSRLEFAWTDAEGEHRNANIFLSVGSVAHGQTVGSV